MSRTRPAKPLTRTKLILWTLFAVILLPVVMISLDAAVRHLGDRGPRWTGFAIGTTLMVVLLLGCLGMLLHTLLRDEGAEKIPRTRWTKVSTLLGIVAVLVAEAIFFLVYNAVSYYDPKAFNIPLSQSDAMYMTVGIATTNGSGYITPQTDLARAVTSTHMAVSIFVIAVALAGIFQRLFFPAKPETASSRTEENDHVQAFDLEPEHPSILQPPNLDQSSSPATPTDMTRSIAVAAAVGATVALLMCGRRRSHAP